MSPYMTIEQAAERAQVSRNTIKKWMKEGLPVLRLSPRMVRIAVFDFDDWLMGKNEGTSTPQGWSETATGNESPYKESTSYRR